MSSEEKTNTKVETSETPDVSVASEASVTPTPSAQSETTSNPSTPTEAPQQVCASCSENFVDGYIWSAKRFPCFICHKDVCEKCSYRTISLPKELYPEATQRQLLCTTCCTKVLMRRMNGFLAASSDTTTSTPEDVESNKKSVIRSETLATIPIEAPPLMTRIATRIGNMLSTYTSALWNTEKESRGDVLTIEVKCPLDIKNPEGESINIRIYTPFNFITPAYKGKSFPAVFYFHGQDFFNGSSTHQNQDITCYYLALKSECIVVSPEYRYAPEFKFPAAHEDSYSAFEWVIENSRAFTAPIDTKKIAVVGVGAGGSIAASVCLMLKERNFKTQPLLQVLITPLTNAQTVMETGSWKQLSEFPPTTEKLKEWLLEFCPVPDVWSDPRLSPALAKDLTNLPPALILLARLDPLRDDGETFAQVLADSGNRVCCTMFNDSHYGFFPLYDEGDEALSQVCLALRTTFNIKLDLPNSVDTFEFGNLGVL